MKKFFTIFLLLSFLLPVGVFARYQPLAEKNIFQQSTSLVSYWQFSGASNDSKGTNNGTDSNMSYGTAYGAFEQGGHFNGTNAGIDVGHGTSLTNISGGSTITISGWFCATAFPATNGRAYIFRQGTEGSSMWGVDILNNGGTSYLDFRTAPPIANGRDQYATTTLATSTCTSFPSGWYHFVAITTGGTANTAIWLNGVSQTIANADTSNANYVFNSSSADVYIGQDSAGNYFSGNIDDLQVWNAGISTSYIASLHNPRSLEGNGISR